MQFCISDEGRKHKKPNTVDGMSVERLTLLGRVHVARVTVDTLQLLADLDTSTAATKPRPKPRYGVKPPKPSPKGKKSW